MTVLNTTPEQAQERLRAAVERIRARGLSLSAPAWATAPQRSEPPARHWSEPAEDEARSEHTREIQGVDP